MRALPRLTISTLAMVTALGVAGCDNHPAPMETASIVKASDFPPVQPRAPGTPGGLPDDKTPMADSPAALVGAQAAADVVQTYFALLSEGQYAQAAVLWGPGAPDRPTSGDALKERQMAYLEYHAQVGAPQTDEGIVRVPVQIYGRNAEGVEVHDLGQATLRRVSGPTGQQMWRIHSIDTP